MNPFQGKEQLGEKMWDVTMADDPSISCSLVIHRDQLMQIQAHPMGEQRDLTQLFDSGGHRVTIQGLNNVLMLQWCDDADLPSESRIEQFRFEGGDRRSLDRLDRPLALKERIGGGDHLSIGTRTDPFRLPIPDTEMNRHDHRRDGRCGG